MYVNFVLYSNWSVGLIITCLTLFWFNLEATHTHTLEYINKEFWNSIQTNTWKNNWGRVSLIPRTVFVEQICDQRPSICDNPTIFQCAKNSRPQLSNMSCFKMVAYDTREIWLLLLASQATKWRFYQWLNFMMCELRVQMVVVVVAVEMMMIVVMMLVLGK